MSHLRAQFHSSFNTRPGHAMLDAETVIYTREEVAGRLATDAVSHTGYLLSFSRCSLHIVGWWILNTGVVDI